MPFYGGYYDVKNTAKSREKHAKISNKKTKPVKQNSLETKSKKGRKKNTLKSSFNDRRSISTQTLIIIIIRICLVGGKVLSPLEGSVVGFDGYRKYYGQLSAYNDRSISLTRTVFMDDIL